MVKAMGTLYLTTTCPDDASWRGAPCNSRDPAEQEGGLAGGEEGEDKNARDEEEDEQEGDDHHGGRLWANMVACPDEQAKFDTVKASLSPLDEGKPCYMGPPRSKACILAASRSFVPDPTTKKGRKKNGGGGSGGGVASTAEDEFALSTLFHIDDDDEE